MSALFEREARGGVAPGELPNGGHPQPTLRCFTRVLAWPVRLSVASLKLACKHTPDYLSLSHLPSADDLVHGPEPCSLPNTKDSSSFAVIVPPKLAGNRLPLPSKTLPFGASPAFAEETPESQRSFACD